MAAQLGAAAGYFRITLGITVVLLGVAVARSRALPRWSAPLALIAGLAFIAVAVGSDGFIGGLPILGGLGSIHPVHRHRDNRSLAA